MRRFLNVVLRNRFHSFKSLHRIDLQRQSFFFDSPRATALKPADAKKPPSASGVCQFKGNGAIRLPAPSITFAVAVSDPCIHTLNLFPMTENKFVCSDRSGRTVLYDSDNRSVVSMPRLHVPKYFPIFLSIPNTHTKDGLETLYVMEGRYISPGDQFEAFVQERSAANLWHCQLLPQPPPCLDESNPKEKEISSYAVVGGGWHICFSYEGFGTYCFDTMRHIWSHVGEWTLPFHGKAEYVPELKLWFGLSAKDHILCAADLSKLDSRPQVVDSWKELEPPEGPQKLEHSELVYLGSGRFCIARSWETSDYDEINNDIDLSLLEYDSFSIFTGVEVVPCGPVDKHNGYGSGSDVDSDNGSVNGNCSISGRGSGSGNDVDSGNGGVSDNGTSSGKVDGKRLQMIKHKSKRYTFNGDGNVEYIF